MAPSHSRPVPPDLAPEEPIIQLDDVHLMLPSAGGEVKILQGIDLTIARGETVGLVGASGSGKSTLMMVAAGLERPTKGRVRVDGQDLTDLSEDALALLRRDRIGIVFQAFHLIPTMSALENVAVPLELAGCREAFERARDQLEKVGLSHRLHHRPSQLSGGEQQRVALARAFAIRPRLLLADEPTGNLDSHTGRAVIDLLFQMQRDSQTTLLLITHDFSLAARCDRVVRMADGRLEQPEDKGSGGDSDETNSGVVVPLRRS